MSRTNLKQFRRLQNPVAKYLEEWNVQWYQKQHLGPKVREASVPYYLYLLRCRFEPLIEQYLSSDTYVSRTGIKEERHFSHSGREVVEAQPFSLTWK